MPTASALTRFQLPSFFSILIPSVLCPSRECGAKRLKSPTAATAVLMYHRYHCFSCAPCFRSSVPSPVPLPKHYLRGILKCCELICGSTRSTIPCSTIGMQRKIIPNIMQMKVRRIRVEEPWHSEKNCVRKKVVYTKWYQWYTLIYLDRRTVCLNVLTQLHPCFWGQTT